MSSKSLTALLLVSTLGACAPSDPMDLARRGVTPVNQPVVSRTDYVLDLNAGGGALPPGEEARLAAWFDMLDLGYGDQIFIDDSALYDSGARADIAAVAGRYGLLVAEGAPVTAGPVSPGNVRVIVSRTEASVPGCPNWSVPSKLSGSNAQLSNYGCAVNSNLANMVADPQDLVRGQQGVPGGDAQTASKGVKVYRDQKPTGAGGLKAEGTTGDNQ
ncbi:MAG: CpaD family pilus assembly protein [Sphingomonadaceae bacterium]